MDFPRRNVKTTAMIPLGLAVLLAVAGCRTPAVVSSAAAAPVWPAPPSPPRIVYESSIVRPSDFGMQRSWWKKTLGFIVGQNYHDAAFAKPMGICTDEQGNLCVTDTGTRSVWYFDLDKRRYRRWERVEDVTFASPVAVAKKDGILYVADSGRGSVVVFHEDGELLFEIKKGLQRPAGVVVAGDQIWVVDSALHRVECFDLKGRYLSGFGRRGGDEGSLNYPTHLTFASAEEPALYVTDAMNFRIQKFDYEGNPLQCFGTIGDVSGSFSRPKGLACDSEGNLFVVDALFENIQIFDAEGRFLMHWGENGTGPGEFWLPTGIAIGADGRIWVCDSYNRRIQVFKRIFEVEEQGRNK